MALQNQRGNYLRIAGTNNSDLVHFEIYRNSEVRHGDRDEFEHVTSRSEYLPGLQLALSATADPEKSIYSNLVAACYSALKAHPDFYTWADC